MILNKKYILALSFIVMFAINVNAQSTTNSPYSKFGVGNIKGSYLPQFRAMGNLAYGISSFGGYQNINVSNPASYSQIRLTAFDVGASADFQNLSKGSLSEKSFNSALSHFTFAVPITKKSAFSFGLLPFSNLGYQSQNVISVDTFKVSQIYSGEGGLSKAYLGYGIGIGKHLNVGVNMSYIFGDLKETRAAEYQKYAGFLNSKSQNDLSIGGLNFDFGVQYIKLLNDDTRLTVGYTGGAKTSFNTSNKTLFTRYQKDYKTNTEFRTDTIAFVDGAKGKLVMPTNHNFGFSIEKINKWVVGADLRLAKWSQYSLNGTNGNLNNTWGFSVGGQITPNIKAVTNYIKLIDYRFGINYDKTYLNINNKDIDVKSINFGFGFPLISARTAFYKINLSTEFGKKGTLDNNLVKEKFINIKLGFTINDRWFQKYKYD
ncbi:MAG: hypothetical protein KKG25_05595 [Bacteroidetes bacterium]|nr:hypothetical protein [Bacteroidota bacterium]MBU1484319.1 hypothetical protein [Bacteroidota bacterium]MBU2266814.1 hypothetical protein [Bacteroidota bacterium]MBU2377017.1 hypothetical protein [Bacteroidota bacterium]